MFIVPYILIMYDYPTSCNSAQYIFFISLQIYSTYFGAIYTHHQEYMKF
jgi:hypothetical protein